MNVKMEIEVRASCGHRVQVDLAVAELRLKFGANAVESKTASGVGEVSIGCRVFGEWHSSIALRLSDWVKEFAARHPRLVVILSTMTGDMDPDMGHIVYTGGQWVGGNTADPYNDSDIFDSAESMTAYPVATAPFVQK